MVDVQNLTRLATCAIRIPKKGVLILHYRPRLDDNPIKGILQELGDAA